MNRSIIVGVAIVIGLCLVVILLLPVLLDLNRYRDRYLSVLEQALHRPVAVEDVRLTIFPKPGVRVRGLTVADDPAFSPSPFLTIPSAEVVVQWMPLLSRRIQVEQVLIQDATVHLIRTQNGALNTATFGKDSSLQPSGKGASGMGGSLKPLLGVFAVEQFSMTGGILQYEDRSQEQSRSYQLANLAFMTHSVQIGQTASFQVQGMLMPYRLSLEMNGRFGPLSSTLDVPMIDVLGRLGKVEVAAQGKVKDGIIELDVQIPNVSTDDDILLDLALAKPVVLNKINAHLMAPLFHNQRLALSQEARIDPLTLDLQLGGSTIHLSGKGTPSRLYLAGESSAVLSEDFPLALAVQRPFSLEQIRFETMIKGGRVELVSLKANAFKGSLEANGKWDGTLSTPMLSLQGHFKNFAVEPMVQVVRSSTLRLTGTGALHWSLAGSLPLSGHPHMNGPVQLRIQNGQLIGFDLVQAIEEALQLPGSLGETTGATKFSLMDAQADLEETGLDIRQLTLEAPDFTLIGAGSIGFNRSLKLQGNLAVSPAIGDRIIQQFPMAKIVRQQGQLVLPFEVTGTVQEPVLQLDTKSLGDQVRRNVERRLEKALQGDEQELQQLLKDGEDLLRQLFGK